MSLGEAMSLCENRLCDNKHTHYCGQCQVLVCEKCIKKHTKHWFTKEMKK